MSLNKYAIIGFPLGHSMSPFIHRRLFDISGISAQYDMLEIRPEELENKFELLKTYNGFNVTIPHKISIIKMCDSTSGVAALYSSVNCVKCDGEITGYNTDAEGFLKTFEHYGVKLSGNVAILAPRRRQNSPLRMRRQGVLHNYSGKGIEYSVRKKACFGSKREN